MLKCLCQKKKKWERRKGYFTSLPTFHFLIVFLLLTLTTLEANHTLPEYMVINLCEKTIGGRRFESEITKNYVKEKMASASHFIWDTFGQDYPKDTKDVKEITLYVTEIYYVDFLQFKNQIHVDLRYIETYKGDDLKIDFTRQLYHAMTNIWQWADAKVRNASHLRESMANFIVWKAGYAPKEWVLGKGDAWDASSAVTALFLDYCSSLRSDFIAKLNKKLLRGFDKNYFHQLLHISVDELWEQYKFEYS